MSSKEGYDVLRLIEHGQSCYISSEYVKGCILAVWLRYHPNLSKDRLLEWIQDITRQLGLIHRCRGNPCYRYVNPYSIIVTQEGQLHFLDMDAKSNEEQLRFMQRRVIREHFLPLQQAYYQKASVRLDIYGLGRTIQYILSEADPEPPLKRREEARFHKIISRCLKDTSKHSYQDISDIRRQIPSYRKRKESYPKARKILAVAGAAILSAAVAKTVLWGGRKPEESHEPATEMAEAAAEKRTINKSAVNEGAVNKDASDQETAGKEAYLELAMAYCLELKDYKKSLQYLALVSDDYAPAKHLEAIVKALDGGGGTGEAAGAGRELKKHLLELEKEAPKDQKERCDLCLIKGYSLLATRDGAENILRLGEEWLEREDLENQEVKEVKEYMASAYEQTDAFEEAAHVWEEILELESEEKKREEVYKKLTSLYEACGQKEMALNTCIKGVGELEDSKDLGILHIRLLCKDTAISRELCAQTIREYIGRMPEILEKEEFQKLQKEYEIRVEGEEVWVGN